MKGLVLDSWPLLAWIRKEQPAARKTRSLLEKASSREMRLWMCLLNLAEVYYVLSKTQGVRWARSARNRLLSLPVELVSVDDELVWEAAEIKARHPVSFADAFCAALARRKGVPVLTGDPDFEYLKKAGTIEVRWLPRAQQSP